MINVSLILVVSASSERNLVVHLDHRVSNFLDYENHTYILSSAELLQKKIDNVRFGFWSARVR